MPGERSYRYFRQSDYLAGLVGADIAADLLKVSIERTETPLDINSDTALDVSASPLEVGTWSAGVLSVQEDTPLDASASPLEVGTWSAGALDASAATVTTDPSPNVSDEAFENGTSLASGNTLTNNLSKPGAKRLTGRVVRASTSYDVHLDVLDSAGGNTLFTIDIATGVAAGTETAIDEKVESPHVAVRVEDAGAASGAVTASLYLR